MHRRTYLVASGALLGAGLPGGVAAERTPTQDEGDANTIACDGAVAEGETVAGDGNTPQPIKFTGSGAEVTDPFDLDGGVTIAEGTHDGELNFIIQLVAEERDHLLINVIGPHEGAAGGIYDEGEYRLDVDADGEWTLAIHQPRADQAEDDADPLPRSLACDGSTWAGPYLFDGLGEAAAAHDGEANFIVEILTHGSSFPELVVNEIGAFEGETTFRADGVGYVVVQADGSWTLDLG